MAQQSTVGKTHTTIPTENGVTRIVYHSTAVVSFDDKLIFLRTGGWRTATTKTRMNQASNQFGLGYYVYQRKGSWYVDFRGTTFNFFDYTLELKR